jgi:hypothetical protein
MIRVDARTVDLTDLEVKASRAFDWLLDEGATIDEAVAAVKVSGPALSDEFYAWLAD